MVSFDVSNLFTSVPTGDCLKIISELLSESDSSDDEVSCILDLLRVALKQNFFVFNNLFFEQPSGLAMGCNLSPFLADIFMDNLENKLFSSSSPWVTSIKFWCRYVDDVFCILSGNIDDIYHVLDLLNGLHPNIHFTHEIEVDHRLNFLDITVSRRDNNSFNFAIFRKSTQTDHCIHSSSQHPTVHKRAFFNSSIHRLFSIPLTFEAFEHELKVILQIACVNGYSVDFVRGIFDKKVNHIHQKLAYIPNHQPIMDFVSIPFLGNISYRISKIIRRNFDNISVSFCCKNTLRSLLVRNKDPINILENSGVYKLICECGANYIGQTGRPFSLRYKEHLRCINNRPERSSFAAHLTSSGHTPSPSNPVVLLSLPKGHKLNVAESIEIFLHAQKDSNLNLNESFPNNQNPLLKVLLNPNYF